MPANYGGFETLVENLVKYHHKVSLSDAITVYCSSVSYATRESRFLSAHLRYIPLNANGAQSILYDAVSLASAVWNRSNVILLLGVSGAIALPLVRFISSARIITNIDGIEWRREKWQGLAKSFLRFSEKMAVRYSHEVISDNEEIAKYVKLAYGVDSYVIPYGGDHTMSVELGSVDEHQLPKDYAFSVCRIEPENNIHIILDAFAKLHHHSLVLVGNWNYSDYGRNLRDKYAGFKNLFLLDPIYCLEKLKTFRCKAMFYVHGHSAGGTNPSLVEAMHFGKPILAFDCNYNRCTTDGKALYFADVLNLEQAVLSLDEATAKIVGYDMLEIANSRYTWDVVAKQYFELLG